MIASKAPVPMTDIVWCPSWRSIPTKYPPTKFFEDLVLDPEDWEAVMEIEAMTDDSVRLAKSDIHLIPELYDAVDCHRAQMFAKQLPEQESWEIVYNSLRK